MHQIKKKEGMQLKVFKCLWGVAKIDEAAFENYHKSGYDGIEFKALNAIKYEGFSRWLKQYDFDFIAQIHTTGGNTIKEHLYSLETLVNTSLLFKPLLINSQSGCDFWEQNKKREFMNGALKIEEKYGVPIAHETHRSRITYNPWVTEDLIMDFPEMKVCCDFSHWVNVCERLLNTENQQVRLAISAAIHLHARVGYEQGPQVPDPRALEYAPQLNAHEKWWAEFLQQQLEKVVETFTVCPEYGPPFYQHTMPNTNKPVSDVAEICDWAMQRLRNQFNNCIIKNKSHD